MNLSGIVLTQPKHEFPYVLNKRDLAKSHS